FIEQFEDAIIEPGEKIGFWFFIRNYADQDMPSNELRFEVETSGQGILPLRQSDVPSSLIPTRGAIRVKGAVPVVVSESALGKPVSATVRVFWRGTLLGSKTYSFQVRNRATIDWVERPILREGLETQVKFRIQNNSSQAISGPIRLELRSDSRQIELVQSTADLPALAPGESREASFKIVGRTDRDLLEIPLALALSDGSRKRVAARDFSGSVPVVNDYRVKLTQGLEGLKNNGVARLAYAVRNVSSRLIFGALELQARVIDAQGREVSGVRWIGFNPQFLMPLERGQQVSFVIPVVLPQGLLSGMVELEVRENGVPVVIHQARF
ncbi:hypothetical protein EBZ37_09000, partial [bacterium]|nr:hypothetical protein [bacterium]